MINSDLINYIKSQLNTNTPENLIISSLSEVGWRMEDIEEGFRSIELEQKTESLEKVKEQTDIKKSIDPYRELPEGVEMDKVEVYNTPVVAKSEPGIKPEPEPKKEPEIKAEVETKQEPKQEERPEPAKIWVPIKIEPKVVEMSSSTDIEPYKIEVAGEKQEEAKVIDTQETPKIQEAPEKFVIPALGISNLGIPKIEIPQEVINSISHQNLQNKTTEIVPKNAMISSYSQDILSASKEKEKAPSLGKRSLFKWIIGIFILLFIGGMVFAFVEGYLKIPGSKFSFSFVKKDPKIIILNAPSVISKLKSYKVETNISISSPSLSNITTGLASGEVVNSKDKDSMSINIKGSANHTEGKLLFDYLLKFKSSILKSDIVSSLKYDGSLLFASVPDLKQILEKDTPAPTTISFSPNQLGLIIPEFSPSVQDIIKKIDIYNILSGEIPPYIKTETIGIFKEFIKGLEYVDKGKESIHGVDTYHYELVANRLLTKKLLSSLSGLFISNLSTEQQKKLDEALGSSSINSFEVWVGKNDDNLYQVQFTLNLPLSKVLGLSDSGIADNEVNLNWKTTYYDLDVENNISIPKAKTDMDGFIRNIKNLKIKNIISDFKPQATALHNAIGSYGLKSNSTGSCSAPASGSLFSPLGHKKSSATAVGAISSSMNSLLLLTNGEGSCYSTPSAWALGVSLFTESPSLDLDSPANKEASFYCTDSTGNTTTLTSPIKGASCVSPKDSAQ